ncbi:hypothetical protein [Streptomyces sp. NRRL F-5135]|uniref:hypothetical protein n=1 Tax=Streptomyces sp. NRRL F-5135 TaxID=1463858 RepID=UPI00068DA37F|nr:hypothetical protein [Streptomyces sp. NRRL F-5135]
MLEERGDAEGAITAYRQADRPTDHDPNSTFALAQLLARHGRGNEAIDLMSVQANARNGDDWILHPLSDQCSDQGRPEDGPAHLDALTAARGGEEERDLYSIRPVRHYTARVCIDPVGTSPYHCGAWYVDAS